MSHRVFGIVGWKNSGKTTLTERLVGELSARGLKVSTLKHAHHDFDIDREGTDSHRHRMAGAAEVAIVSSRRFALIRELRGEEEPDLARMLDRLSPCDLVLAEGFKTAGHPKIECRRRASADQAPLAARTETIVAIASDAPTEAGGRPLFDLDDIAAIADFILARTGAAAGAKRP